MNNAMRDIGRATLALSILTGVASGQTPDGFTGIPVKIGDTVTVVGLDGAQLTGRVSGVAATLLTVDGQQVAADRTLKIDRVGDPLWNGIRNGALVGVAVFKWTLPGALIMNAAIDRDCYVNGNVGCFAAMIAASAAVGGFWDWLRVGRTTVFVNGAVREPRVSVAPRVGPGHVSVRASIGWR